MAMQELMARAEFRRLAEPEPVQRLRGDRRGMAGTWKWKLFVVVVVAVAVAVVVVVVVVVSSNA